MGVIIFDTALDYKYWVEHTKNKRFTSVVVFDNQLVVTCKLI